MKSRENLMGNYRFRLSDMMPNAWFYKLKDMGKTRNQTNKKQNQSSSPSSSISQPKNPNLFYPRKSYYFTRELVPSDGFYVSRTTNTKSAASQVLDKPRKSSQKRSRKRNNRSSSTKLVSSSVSAGCRCRASLWTKTDSPPQYSASSSSDGSSPPQEFRSDCILTTRSFDNMVSLSHSSSSSCKAMNSEAKDIVIVDDDNKSSVRKFDKLDEFDNLSELQLPRIITKPVEFNHNKEETTGPTNHRRSSSKTCPGRKFVVNSPGVKLRINSPKIGTRKFQGLARKSVSSSSRKNLSESFAVVKSSFDPQKDFRESMVEMIIENNIRTSKDLEDLLACYLSLNSDEYHGLIIKVFKQIWFDLSDARLK